MSSVGLFGPRWPLTEQLADRAEVERDVFLEWMGELDLTPPQYAFLRTMVRMAEPWELVDARCAVVTYPAEIARRAKVDEKFADVISPLIQAGHLTADPASAVGIDGPGVVFRVRRPGVVLTIEAAGPLWPRDVWTAMRAG